MDTKEIEDKLKELYKLKRELLMSVVGMSYKMDQVKKIDEQIKKLERVEKWKELH